jgi:tetratricopeptide (TPR) repeat protein
MRLFDCFTACEQTLYLTPSPKSPNKTPSGGKRCKLDERMNGPLEALRASRGREGVKSAAFFLPAFIGIMISHLGLAFSSDQANTHLLKGSELVEKELYAQAAPEFEEALRLEPTSFPAAYNLGFAYWKLRKLELASKAFQKALRLDPTNAPSQYYLGQIQLLQGHTDEAIAAFRQLTARQGPPVADEHYQLGLAYLKKGEAENAIQWLSKAAELYPREPNVKSSLGKAYLLAGRKEEADQAFSASKVIRDQNLEATQLLQSCRQHLQSRDFEKAFEIRKRLLAFDDSEFLIAVGTLFGESGLPEQAIEPLGKALTLNGNSFEAQFNLGYTLLGLGKEDLAEKHLERATELRPDSFEAQSLLGVVRSNRKENLPAIESLRRAVELRPKNLRALSMLALQYIEGRYYEEAVPALTRAIQLNPSDPDLRFLLIQAHYKNQDSVKALQLAQETLQQYPLLARAHYELGFQLASMGRFEESKAPFKKALDLQPDYPEALYALGDLLVKEDKPAEALPYLQQALRLNSNYTEASSSLGRALLALKRYDDVVGEMRKVVAYDAAEPEPHLHLAQAYRALGQDENAKQELQTFNQLNQQRMKRTDQQGVRRFPSQGEPLKGKHNP